MKEIIKILRDEFDEIDDFDKKVELLNEIREELAELSPFEEPVDVVKWVKAEEVEGNEYNPNEVADPEMELLYKSIKMDGYTQPIVTYKMPEKYEVVDGFHRNLVGKEYKDIKKRLNGYLPLTVIDKPLDERMGSTIRHNRARGTHQIQDMSSLVVKLSQEGWSDEEICDKLGMEKDEVIRLKQVSGLKKAFSDHEFSSSWDEFESKYYEDEDNG